MLRILVTEDDDELRLSLVLVLRRAGHDVLEANNAAAARKLLPAVDLLLTDLRLPDDLGTTLLLDAKRQSPRMQIIVMTGYATIDSAIEATRNGARDYLLKPFEMDLLLRHVGDVDRLLGLQRNSASVHGGLVGTSAAMKQVLTRIDVAATNNSTVLIEGETGTGKERVAQAIHERSGRRDQQLVAVNLAALPNELVDSELFGHERGAFTHATSRRQGRFVLAGTGTIFLDEINSLPLAVQPKLLRALETREIWPVGAERPMFFKARIIAASNQPLSMLVEQGGFRADLFYRLDIVRINVPPLREHPEDIPLLVRVLLDRSDVAPRGQAPIEIASDAVDWLVQQPWPGNVRELKNLLERTLLQSPALQRKPPRLERQDFVTEPRETTTTLPFKEAQSAAAEAWSRAAVMAALQQAGGNRTQAAKILQMNRTALLKLLKKLDIGD